MKLAQLPTFAVVGHPNKGKSSIVSTLMQDDAVPVSPRSGTTREAVPYKVQTESATFYLVDTPGFQRPSAALKALQARTRDVHRRPDVLRAWVEEPETAHQFPDEVELLRPILQGAAILYVVDGSRPYGREYEAEMEILRWTGSPSMALINPIEGDAFVQPWRQALGQYFQLVREFNPLTVDFPKQLELMQAFTHLAPAWKPQLESIIHDLHERQSQRRRQAASILAEGLEDMCRYSLSQKVLTEGQARQAFGLLLPQYQDAMRRLEHATFQALLQVFGYRTTSVEAGALSLPDDLFVTDNWYLWGLNRRELATVATVSGFVAGAAVDVAVAGHSFMLGGITGGLAGLAGSWLGARKLAETRVRGLPLGGYLAQLGPMKNPNFPYVLLGRFVHLYRQVQTRTHANRSAIQVDTPSLGTLLERLDPKEKKALHKALAKLSVEPMPEDVLPALEHLLHVAERQDPGVAEEKSNHA